MRDLKKYKGIIPAFYSCYDDYGEISAERTRKLAGFYLEKGVKGLYVEGSSGEAIYHSVDERKLVLDHVISVVQSRLTIIAHIAAPSTRDTIELGKHAKDAGADAIAAIPGMYYSLSEAMVERYWNDILDSVDMDMIIYNIPQTTGFNLSSGLLQRMIRHKRVIGVKNSSMQPYDIQQYKAIGGDDIIIFNGLDEQYIAGRIMGAEGGIGGTYGVMPELFLKLEELFSSGEIEAATDLQSKINNIIQALCSFHCMYASAKAVLALRGLQTGGVRLPFLPVEKNDAPRIKVLFNQIMSLIDAYGK